ncbi:ATP-binding protein [Streptomyces sp. SID8366]|uniref:ATP-binding protein n=1 Tax=unclassified Streptomyces TaxID=2593676 RepID=UPI000DB9F57D|nr:MULTISPECIES: ATP-binding protein [unclassified Streptomyces]MYU07923.1 ATP-binding protein [Streptomyces sp. SID8366]MYU63365.1 ATP-binding protein [Streptomyces sp. SID69]RAJ59115.1 histidine kinase-like protein [Streptomyces sp. PsTaAH-130]
MPETYSIPVGEAHHRPPCRPADARRTVRRVVAERCRARHQPLGPGAMDDALLVTSELTTNAILHGGGITGFDVDVDSAGVRVSVSDHSTDLPVMRTPAPDHVQRHGRGWPIVCHLARDVRVSELPCGGKCITAVVPLA